MFEPALGVSLVVISKQLDLETIDAVRASKIATLEITPAVFAGTGMKPHLKRMLSEGPVRAASVHALFGGEHDVSVLDGEGQLAAAATARSAVELATQLGAGVVVFHASAEPIEPRERPARLDQAASAFYQIGLACTKAGVRGAVEILPRSCLCNTVEEALTFLDVVGQDVLGVCLDTNHLMDRHAQLADSVRTLGDRLVTLHLSDYDGVDEKHWMPGADGGVVDWPAFMHALRDIDYQGPFNYECRPPGETAAERVRALEKNFEWLSGL